MKKQTKEFLFLFAILLLQIGLMIYFGFRKEGLFLDELWTFNLANGYFFPMLSDASDYYNQWLSGTFFHEALTVTKPFAFDSVFYNQSADVHPPLYYMIIHFICSLTIGEYSKWHGIVPNIVFFALSQILLFVLTKKISNESRLAILVCLIYGFSLGAISTCLSIRMYMLLTFICLFVTYVHYNYLVLVEKSGNSFSKMEMKALMTISLTYMLGFLSHYYFVIYAFFFSLFFLLVLCVFFDRKRAFNYVISTFFGIFGAVAVFPACLNHILGSGYRGVEAFNNLQRVSTGTRLQNFLYFLNVETGSVWIVFISLMVIVIYVLAVRIATNKQRIVFESITIGENITFKLTVERMFLLILSLAVVMTFSLIAKVAAFEASRYIWNLYPITVLLMTLFSWSLFSFILNKSISTVIVGLIFIVIMVPNIRSKNVSWLQISDKPMNELLENNINSPKKLIAITRDKLWWQLMHGVKFYEKLDYVFMTTIQDIKSVQLKDDAYLLFLSNHQISSQEAEIIFDHIKEMGYNKSKPILAEWYGTFFELTKDRGNLLIQE